MYIFIKYLLILYLCISTLYYKTIRGSGTHVTVNATCCGFPLEEMIFLIEGKARR